MRLHAVCLLLCFFFHHGFCLAWENVILGETSWVFSGQQSTDVFLWVEQSLQWGMKPRLSVEIIVDHEMPFPSYCFHHPCDLT